ncbi:hypothetical protein JW756_04430 [Candidatus Woesearchaeota archaeon]|nr:hypothetical protein [Candidatus Woesearchaeota archaeon]
MKKTLEKIRHNEANILAKAHHEMEQKMNIMEHGHEHHHEHHHHGAHHSHHEE